MAVFAYEEISLNGKWDLCGAPCDQRKVDQVFTDMDTVYQCEVPGDIHDALIQANKIHDPRAGVFVESSLWAETYQWWYRKELHIKSIKSDCEYS